MDGFYNRIITVNLTDQTFAIEHLPDELLARCLGGKGLATHLLLERNPVGIDPLEGGNHLIFATGPCCNSRIWGASRYGVYTKSPLTGFYAESYSGGKVPEAMDATGFDAFLFTGISPKPAAVAIHPQGVEFFDAGDLWGRETFETESAALKRFGLSQERYGQPGAVVIGPAAERLVRFALIANDKWRCAGRAGVGTVMGAKRLKAVIFQGDRRRVHFQPEAVAAYSKAFSKAHMHGPGVEAYRAMGTTMMVALMNTVGAFPARYWRQGTCDHWEDLSGETFHREHRVKPHACAKCFMACGRMATISKGRHQGLKLEGPEYETIYAFGGLCMVQEITEVAHLNDLCDRLGMDTITVGNLCGLAIEARRRGKLDFEIDYGDTDRIAHLIRLIAARQGIGAVLADGIAPAARTLGLEALAIHVKGMEPAGYDPRLLKGMGLTYATSDRGACHLRTTFYKPELAGLIPPDQIQGKAEMLIEYEDRLNIFDSLILCRFYRDLYTWEELEKLVHMVTGLPSAKADLRRLAGSICTMTRCFNIREGLTPADDHLPHRFHSEKLPSGHCLTADEMGTMLKDYYTLREWNEQGVPLAMT